jgi:hypothetical protein
LQAGIDHFVCMGRISRDRQHQLRRFGRIMEIYKSKAECLVCTIAKAAIRMHCRRYEQGDLLLEDDKVVFLYHCTNEAARASMHIIWNQLPRKASIWAGVYLGGWYHREITKGHD